jgi:hypothetical protein
MKKLKPKKSRYKSDIIKKRNQRLLGKLNELERVADLEHKKNQEALEELIKTSPTFAGINHLCTQVIPLYPDFELGVTNFDIEEESLSYTYSSKTQWNQVKDFYTDWFVKQHWQFVDESRYDKFPNNFTVRTADHKITLFTASVFDNYYLICKKIKVVP